MYVREYISILIHVYTNICIYACFACVCVCVCVYVYSVYIYIYVYIIHVHRWVFDFEDTLFRLNERETQRNTTIWGTIILTHTHAHAHSHAHTHTHTHTHVPYPFVTLAVKTLNKMGASDRIRSTRPPTSFAPGKAEPGVRLLGSTSVSIGSC